MRKGQETIESNHIAKQIWNYEINELNGLKSSDISVGSHNYAAFICPICGQGWNGIIRDAIRIGKCPVCRKKEIIEQKRINRKIPENALAIMRPDLVDEWVYEENEKLKLTPDTISCNSNIKIYWRCRQCSNIYMASVINRTKLNSGCPYCSGQKVKKRFNDFASLRPDLLTEWDYELNEIEQIFPDEYTIGTKKMVNWICPMGHKYKRSIYDRNRGGNCAICGKRSQTSLPEQAIYYYIKRYFKDAENRYKLNNKMEIDVYIPSLNVGIEYDGIYYHSSSRKIAADEKKDRYFSSHGIVIYRIKEVDENSDCSDNEHIIYVKENAANRHLNEAIIILLDSLGIENADVNLSRDIMHIYSLYLNTQKENSVYEKSEYLSEWDEQKNKGLDPRAISNNSNIKVWWRCSLGHSYQSSPKNRNSKQGCPYCAGKKVLKGFNDLQSYAEQNLKEIIEEWDSYANNEKLDEIYFRSITKYKWKCLKCGRSYEKTAYARIKGSGCQYCAHKKVDKEISFGHLHPTALLDWNYELNQISPFEVAEFSNKHVWWKCHICGNEFKASITSRAKGFRCKYCSVDKVRQGSHATRVKKRGSLLEKNPLLIEEWDFEKNDVQGIFPDKVTSGSGLTVWWKCSKCSHNWEDTINARKQGKQCPNCRYTPYPKARKNVSEEQKREHLRKVQENAKITRIKKRGSLRENRPLLMADWDFTKNDIRGITPDEVTIGSKYVVWWKCSKCLCEWEDSIQSRSYGKKCPSCGNTHYPGIRKRG